MATKSTSSVPDASPGQAPTASSISSYSWGDSSGPWLIETQSSWFDYARVPDGTLATEGLSLSSASPTYNFQGTHLLVNWTATVRSVSSTDLYTTSSFQQNQKFKVNSVSTDYLGNSYGSSSDYGTSTMGPAGNVYSDKKFYKRVLWNSNLHSSSNLFNENVVGANYVMETYASGVDASSTQSTYLNDFPSSWIAAIKPGTLLWDHQPHTRSFSNLYNMQGKYNPQDETFSDMISTLDFLGNMTSNFQFAAMPPIKGKCGGTASAGYAGAAPINVYNNIALAPCYGYQTNGFIDGCAHYDVNRHDYS